MAQDHLYIYSDLCSYAECRRVSASDWLRILHSVVNIVTTLPKLVCYCLVSVKKETLPGQLVE